jgi:hypothetical protein
MIIKLEIKRRNREYGIVTWPYAMDFEVKTLMQQKDIIDIKVGNAVLPNHVVSYKYRRFNIGKKLIRKAGDVNFFIITKVGANICVNFE